MNQIFKYPRTPHIAGSKLQVGDHDLKKISFEELKGKHLVVEEKMDGANSGISFGPEGQLLLQSRGHYLVGGPRERHFDLFKTWGNRHANALRTLLGERYVAYGEWCYAKHTMFYNRLPHYWMEFDIRDLETGRFLSTRLRREFWSGSPVVSVPVLFEGQLNSYQELMELVGQSTAIAGQPSQDLRQAATELGQDPERVVRETDVDRTMEGLYIKVEEDDQVVARYKWVRAGFLQAVTDSNSHWLDRPILPNQLQEGVDLFA